MDFTRYLTTLLSHQSLQRTHLQARRELVEFRIDVYRALGGSWVLTQPPRAQVRDRRPPLELSVDARTGQPVTPPGRERSQ